MTSSSEAACDERHEQSRNKHKHAKPQNQKLLYLGVGYPTEAFKIDTPGHLKTGSQVADTKTVSTTPAQMSAADEALLRQRDAAPATRSEAPPMPTHRPGAEARPPPPLDVLTCPLHCGTWSRNTSGHYPSYAPDGAPDCRVCRREALEMHQVARIERLDAAIRAELATGHPSMTTEDNAYALRGMVLDLEARTSQLPVPCQYARRALRLWEGTRELHYALLRYQDAPDGSWEKAKAKEDLEFAVAGFPACTDRFTRTTHTYKEALRIVSPAL